MPVVPFENQDHDMKQVACIETWMLADGTTLKLRPIAPADAAMEQAFVRGLSTRSRYLRFHNTIKELNAKQLTDLTQPDPNKATALIVVHDRGKSEEEIAVARYVIGPDRTSCEFAIVVADAWQRRGIGTRLLRALIRHAQTRGIKRIYDSILESNLVMRKFAERMGFDESKSPDDPSIVVITKYLT